MLVIIQLGSITYHSEQSIDQDFFLSFFLFFWKFQFYFELSTSFFYFLFHSILFCPGKFGPKMYTRFTHIFYKKFQVKACIIFDHQSK